MFGYIYLTTNLVNNRKYIGQKKGEFNPNYYGSGLVLKQAVKKYGKDNFKIEILQYAKTREELNELEKYFIELNDACSSYDFYNIHEGGHGGNTKAGYTEEQMKAFSKKVSETKLLQKRHLTDSEKDHLREVFSGENNPMYGKVGAMKDKHHTKETREKMSKSKKGKVPHLWLNGSREKLSSALKEHYSNSENREKCSRKDEENGMATPVKIIFPWGEEKEFSMIKSMAEFMQEHYDVHPKTTKRLVRSKEPWIKIKRLKHRHLEGLLIKKI